MVRQLPDGVYLKQVDQKGKTIKLVGYAQSNARVASLMRNLDASPWLEGSTLIETKAAMVNGLRVNEFTMEVKLTAPQQEVEEKKPSKKTASVNLVGGRPV